MGWGKNVYSNSHGHMAKMLPYPYMVIIFANLLLPNCIAKIIETWYTASGTRALPSLFK